MEVSFAATQMACDWDREANIARADAVIREAAGQGANVILLQELFETPYFCQEQKADFFKLARPAAGHPVLAHMQALARELGVVLPVSFFEQAHNSYFNSLAMIDADGALLGVYRKSHIPAGPGYQEKFYFTPGNTGFQVWQTGFGCLGAAICWDQWFVEAARIMVLNGAEALLYPTAIGSEPPPAPPVESRAHWQRTMQGHAAANMVPVVASNRIGTEHVPGSEITFYGSSFIAGPTGELVAEAGAERQEIITARFDLAALRAARDAWGLFRDRRPDLYGKLVSASDGH